MINHIFQTSEEIKDNRTIHSIFTYLQEEIGELGTEINIQEGFSKKSPGPDGIPGEIIDCILCLVDLLHRNHPDLTEADLVELTKSKCKKWKGET